VEQPRIIRRHRMRCYSCLINKRSIELILPDEMEGVSNIENPLLTENSQTLDDTTTLCVICTYPLGMDDEWKCENCDGVIHQFCHDKIVFYSDEFSTCPFCRHVTNDKYIIPHESENRYLTLTESQYRENACRILLLITTTAMVTGYIWFLIDR